MSFAEALAALSLLLSDPALLVALVAGVPLGMVFGAVPGLGGKVGIALLIPVVFGMDAMTGAVLLVSMHAVVHTGGSIPSILLGIPGTGPDAATVVDGHPMTLKGEGDRALGASLTASAVGGVIGAVFLAAFLPVIEPVMLLMGPPEFFFLAIFGITLIASLSGLALARGLAIGCIGILVATVGLDLLEGYPRYTFGQLFLWDGVDLITAMLGIYAIPEMCALAARRPATQGDPVDGSSYRGLLRGCGDVFRHWALTLRTSIMGAVVGLIPGLGGDAASWLCYGHAVQSSRTPERFGKGAVEGVIAPETANNSKEGGALLPTIFFGVPGSSGMALLLGAFVVLGIQPGPHMIREGLELVWVLIWALALSNVIATVSFLGLCRPLGRLAMINSRRMVPFVFVFAILSTLAIGGAWQHSLMLILFGALGCGFKAYGWPRAPFVVGLILGPIAEVSLMQSLAIWGPAFVLRPGALILAGLTIASVVWYVARKGWRRRGAD